MATAQDSPNKPRPADPLTREIADALNRIERNYEREGSGPGSRFEGRLLEDVQAEYAVGHALGPAARKYLALLDEATRLLYAQVSNGSGAARVQAIRHQAGLEAL
jgi:hypothetical protein